MAEEFKLYKSDDGNWFYTKEEAAKWDEKLKKGKQNIIEKLRKLSSPEKVQPKFDSLIQELLPEEFDDFLVGIESVQKTIENFAFNQESYWNLKDKEISPEKHSEETSIRKLTRMQPCKRDMEWLEKHRVPFTPPANQSDDA